MGDKGDGAATATSADGAASVAISTVAPPAALRKNLVDVAVKFLNNPRVVDMCRSIEEKRAFLQKKGLKTVDQGLGLCIHCLWVER